MSREVSILDYALMHFYRFVSSSELSASATLYGISYHSPKDRHLQIETSTFNAIPGQNIVLHVRNNFFITHFNYVVSFQACFHCMDIGHHSSIRFKQSKIILNLSTRLGVCNFLS